jgi:hypothetical protein
MGPDPPHLSQVVPASDDISQNVVMVRHSSFGADSSFIANVSDAVTSRALTVMSDGSQGLVRAVIPGSKRDSG